MYDLLDEVEEALRQAGCKPVRHGDRIRARCPVHGGDNPSSLSVTRGHSVEVTTLCFSGGCKYDQIMDALGIEVKRRGRDDEIVYPYRNSEGRVLYGKRRFGQQKRGGGKNFDWVHQESDEWKSGRNAPDDMLVPYRLPEITAAIEAGERVYVVEGEKDADVATLHGMAATTFPDGSGSKMHPHYRSMFRNADVVVIADADDPGQKYAETVKDFLLGFAKSVQSVTLFEAGSKKDLYDWFSEGYTLRQLEALIDGSWRDDHSFFVEEIPPPAAKALMDYGMEGLVSRRDCYMPGIGEGILAVISARPSVGKTTWLCELAWRIAVCGKKVMFFSMDERGERIGPMIASSFVGDARYSVARISKYVKDCGIPQGKIVVIEKPRTIQEVRAKVASFRPDFVMVDHVKKVKASGSGIDKIERAMTGLAEIRDDLKCCVIVASQLNRDAESVDRLVDGSHLYGADAITQDADLIITMQKPCADKSAWDHVKFSKAREIASIDTRFERYRVLQILKSRIGAQGPATARWIRLCGTERRIFPLHEAKCECSFCNQHREVIKKRAKFIEERGLA